MKDTAPASSRADALQRLVSALYLHEVAQSDSDENAPRRRDLTRETVLFLDAECVRLELPGGAADALRGALVAIAHGEPVSLPTAWGKHRVEIERHARESLVLIARHGVRNPWLALNTRG